MASKPCQKKRAVRKCKIKEQAREPAIAEIKDEVERKRKQADRRQALKEQDLKIAEIAGSVVSDLKVSAKAMLTIASQTKDMIAKQLVTVSAREKTVKEMQVDLSQRQAASKAAMRHQLSRMKAAVAKVAPKKKMMNKYGARAVFVNEKQTKVQKNQHQIRQWG